MNSKTSLVFIFAFVGVVVTFLFIMTYVIIECQSFRYDGSKRPQLCEKYWDSFVNYTNGVK